MAVILETSLGDLTVDLYTDERPKCCENFLKLCKIKYYNFSLFHSVQRNLVAQTGDPTGTGKGGGSIFGILYGDQAKYFNAEVKPRIKHKKMGLLSMVNNGDHKHGSQFFVTLAPDIDYLDSQRHTVFGEVAEGWDVIDKLNEAFVDKDGRPYKDIRLYHTAVIDDPFDDPELLAAHIPDRSPEPSKEQLQSARIGVDEKIDDFEGMKQDAIDELTKAREAKANAELLEMIGDLPDADVKPPDNVLFVCKLNPVTSQEDLEIIFSRFGPIEGCEVIKDQKTGESLQYAFIEFEKPDDCESAYFKMDNVLIDDRRIHVDFSQSVAKVKWKGKGKGVEIAKPAEDRQLFVIKDRSKKDHYELLMDDEKLESDVQKKLKKKKKKHKKEKKRKSDSESESEEESRKHSKKKSKRSRSRSVSRSPVRERPQRRDREELRDAPRPRSRERDYERDRGRDYDRGRGGGRQTDRDRKRDFEGDRDRDRKRDFERDRDRDRNRDFEGERDRDRDQYHDRKREKDRDRRGDRDQR